MDISWLYVGGLIQVAAEWCMSIAYCWDFSPGTLWSSRCNSFEDWAPVDLIYGCPVFKWVAVTWPSYMWLQESSPSNGPPEQYTLLNTCILLSAVGKLWPFTQDCIWTCHCPSPVRKLAASSPWLMCNIPGHHGAAGLLMCGLWPWHE